ncbi:MAG: alpha/beta hydrolase [Bacteroidia bacterium]|nr:alpha/beta hydrolase [Bacteroidia bacterium]
MKKTILYFWILVLSSMSIQGQNDRKFLEKWEESQRNADKIVQEYTKKNPEIKHYKAAYKSFYDSIAGKETILDMYIEVPPGNGSFPVVIFVHGGGFIGGNKSNFTHQTFALANKGVVGITIEYRLKGHGGTHPLYVADVMDAIDFVRMNAGKYHIDFSRLGLSGGSAGAYLSSYAAMKSPECVCYIGYNGGYDVSKKALPDALEKYRIEASPISIIKTPPPATLLFHGKDDTTIDFKKSELFAEAIRAKGGIAEVVLFEGQKHSFFNKEPYLTQTTEMMVKHVLSVFKLSEN